MTELKIKTPRPALEGRPKLISRKISLRADQEAWLVEKGQAGLAINEYIRRIIDDKIKDEKNSKYIKDFDPFTGKKRPKR